MSTTNDAAGLAGLRARAEAEATRFFGDGPVTAWRTEAGRSPLSRSGLGRAAFCITACLAAVLVAMVSSPDFRDAVQPATASAADDIVDDVPAAVTLAAKRSAVPTPAPSLAVTHDGRWWRIEAVAASRLEAAHQLARLNGLALRGATAQLAGTRALNLRWQGRDPAAAWQAVLGTEVNYALQCGADRCRAWIINGGESGLDGSSLATTASPVGAQSSPPDNAAEAPPPRDRIDPPEPTYPD